MPVNKDLIERLKKNIPINRMPEVSSANNKGKVNKLVKMLNEKFSTPEQKVEFLRSMFKAIIEKKKSKMYNESVIQNSDLKDGSQS